MIRDIAERWLYLVVHVGDVAERAGEAHDAERHYAHIRAGEQLKVSDAEHRRRFQSRQTRLGKLEVGLHFLLIRHRGCVGEWWPCCYAAR